MQVRPVVERVTTVMHLVIHAESLGQMGGLQDRRDAALDRHVAAQIVRRLLMIQGTYW